jgi:hypothetical protein
MLQLQQNGNNIYDHHSGVSMVLECVMKYSKPRASLNRNPNVWMNTLSVRNTNGGGWGGSLTLPTNQSSRFNEQQYQQNQTQQQLKFFRDYFKKRSLLLYLLSHELDHLFTFLNPFNSPNFSFERIDIAINHLKFALQEKPWIENIRVAWSILPALVIHLPSRFPFDFIMKEVQRLVKSQRTSFAYTSSKRLFGK